MKLSSEIPPCPLRMPHVERLGSCWSVSVGELILGDCSANLTKKSISKKGANYASQ